MAPPPETAGLPISPSPAKADPCSGLRGSFSATSSLPVPLALFLVTGLPLGVRLSLSICSSELGLQFLFLGLPCSCLVLLCTAPPSIPSSQSSGPSHLGGRQEEVQLGLVGVHRMCAQPLTAQVGKEGVRDEGQGREPAHPKPPHCGTELQGVQNPTFKTDLTACYKVLSGRKNII